MIGLSFASTLSRLNRVRPVALKLEVMFLTVIVC